MNYFHWIAGCMLGIVWFSRLVDAALGVPSIADISRPEWDQTCRNSPRVSVVVPARNEEHDLEQMLRRLVALDYDNYEVIAVDDRSSDHRGEIMAQLASVRHSESRQHPSSAFRLGGKDSCHVDCGPASDRRLAAVHRRDVQFKPDSVRRAMVYAEAERADHVVLFPRMIMNQPGEKMMTAFFQTLFVFGHRPWKVADPRTREPHGRRRVQPNPPPRI